jgi:hypothetical protein
MKISMMSETAKIFLRKKEEVKIVFRFINSEIKD